MVLCYVSWQVANFRHKAFLQTDDVDGGRRACKQGGSRLGKNPNRHEKVRRISKLLHISED